MANNIEISMNIPFVKDQINQFAQWINHPELESLTEKEKVEKLNAFKNLLVRAFAHHFALADKEKLSSLLNRCWEYSAKQTKISTAVKACDICEKIHRRFPQLDVQEEYLGKWKLLLEEIPANKQREVSFTWYYKTLLSQSSPFFKALFESGFKEKSCNLENPITLKITNEDNDVDGLKLARKMIAQLSLPDVQSLPELVEMLILADQWEMQAVYKEAKKRFLQAISRLNIEEEYLSIVLNLLEVPTIMNDCELIGALTDYQKKYMSNRSVNALLAIKDENLNRLQALDFGSDFGSRGSFWIVSFLQRCPHLRQMWVNNKEELVALSAANVSSLEWLSISFPIPRDEDLSLLKKINSLKTLHLHHCEGLSGMGFGYLGTHLETLYITRGNTLTNDGLKKIPSSLKTLNLSFCRLPSSESLQHLTSLKKLELMHCYDSKSEKHLFISNFCFLESLNLVGCQVTDDVLESLKSLTFLKELNLKLCGFITNKGLQSLETLTSLEALDLSFSKITDEGLRSLLELKSLERLYLESCQGITDEGFKLLGALPLLKFVCLDSCNIEDEGLRGLSLLTSLNQLSLKNCLKLTNQGLKNLSRIKSLESLSLACCNDISDEGLYYLRMLPSLKSLNLRGCGITSKGLQYVAQISSIESLDLSWCGKKITDEGLQSISALESLESLSLIGADEITDKGLQHLKTLISLKTLKLKFCNRLTREGVQELLDTLPFLESIDFFSD